MIFSIRKRLFINIIALMVPLCFFAWMLMSEVDKQVDFAKKETNGIELQKPLTQLLYDVHQRKLAEGDTGAIDGKISEAKAALDRTYNENAADVGFNEAKWTALKDSLDKALGEKANDEAITAIKAMITRSSDGSNLTLDPDLDSYYAMDVGSFAIPAAIDNLGNAQAELLAIIKNHTGALTPAQFGRVETLKYMFGNDASRITDNLGITLAEDANFYGESASIARLKPLIAAYETQHTAMLALLQKLQEDTANVNAEQINTSFTATNAAVFALRVAVPEELEILLQKRVIDLKGHKQNLLTNGGIAVVIGLALFWVISQSIVAPITRLRRVMRSLAAGELDIDIPHANKRDEIGQMAKAVVVFKDNAITIRDLAKEFQTSVQNVVDIVASAATELDAASKNLTHEATDSHKRLQILNGDIGSVSDNMGTISAASAQLFSAINEISEQVQKSTATTGQAVIEADNVKKVAVHLSEAATKVSGVVNLINTIASKINLLALNATIEAARAGEAGKGFAVVASEVKSLASQTASATAEIGQLVAAIQDSSSQTLGAVEHISDVIEQINHISGSIAAAVEEQGVATKDIAGHIQQATNRMMSVTTNANAITESSAHSAAASAQTLQASGDLSKQSEILRGDVSNFLRKLVAS